MEGLTIPDGAGPIGIVIVTLIGVIFNAYTAHRNRIWTKEDLEQTRALEQKTRQEERDEEERRRVARAEELRLEIQFRADDFEREIKLARIAAETAYKKADDTNGKLIQTNEHIAQTNNRLIQTTGQIATLSERFAQLLEREGVDRRDATAQRRDAQGARREMDVIHGAQLDAMQATGADTNARMQDVVPDRDGAAENAQGTTSPTVGEQISETHDRVTRSLKIEEDRRDAEPR